MFRSVDATKVGLHPPVYPGCWEPCCAHWIILSFIILFFQEGYKQGLAAGEESKLQEGFDSGYKHSMSQAYQLARMRGILWYVSDDNQIIIFYF
jgi:hypothetical protein